MVVRVERPGAGPDGDAGLHPSELELDGITPDHVLRNTGTLSELRHGVRALFDKLGERMFDLIRQAIRDNPVRVRTTLGAFPVLVGHYIPAVADVAVNDQAMDAITFLVILFLSAGASRKAAAKYNPGTRAGGVGGRRHRSIAKGKGPGRTAFRPGLRPIWG
ncbi:hypothetical protein K2224_27050 [Streptomyces sp. BHT-5-2]|uniref:hypothetical protein n=1 Tax=Streptomyces sp. BHT-5-2 TaxID=2866715 RepID=UPI001C8D06EA|nr:hypothetical protein [Streptomyces sp. BHT-5-2]QZL06380.1 hypothetical protein K2224_27050 [Streptomyces sp. BHT-5-2]